jgi:hypothetical protein
MRHTVHTKEKGHIVWGFYISKNIHGFLCNYYTTEITWQSKSFE